MSRKILESALESASFNIIFQVCLRFTTFFLNAFVLRFVTQAVVGVMNVRLLLLESTILFLSREAFRRAALSQTESFSWPQIINLIWLTVPLSVAMSFIFSMVWLRVLSVPSYNVTPHYSIGVYSVSVSCVIEMLAEPLYIVSQAFLFNKLKIALDSLMVLVRTLIFVFWIILNSKQAVIAFSVAQLSANLLYCTGYYVYFYFYIKNINKKNKIGRQNISTQKLPLDKNIKNDFEKSRYENLTALFDDSKTDKNVEEAFNVDHNFQEKEELYCDNLKRRKSSEVDFEEPFPFQSLFDFLPKFVENKPWIHPKSAKLTWSFFKQGILKQILTEGERYIMTVFSVMSFKEQGTYDIVNNLGSLAARFLFRPIEDSLYFYFTQSIKRDVKIIEQNKERMNESSSVLYQSLKCITSLGLIVFTFGQTYSTLLLYLYGGEIMAAGEGPKLLRAHSFSVLLLGINGITECYTFSTMTAHQLNKYNYLMAIFSILFLLVSWSLTKLFGCIGFIFANYCIMLARIAHSIIFIKCRYKNTTFKPLQGLLPNIYFLFVLGFTLFVTKTTEKYFSKCWHLASGGICFILVISVWSYLEKDFIFLCLKKWKTRKIKKQ